MDQSAGRFLTMDTWWGRAFDPLSLHKYLYAHGSPIDRRDPAFTLRGETDLWWDAKMNIIKYAPELVLPECRPTVRLNPEDRCFP
ncbi:MAG TPA: hypothetical protein VF544_21240 [Pyrinomonadaceae bacterium]|jgi:hypothetical protein